MTEPAPAAPPAPFVRPDVRRFLDAIAAAPGPRMHEMEPAQVRAMRDVGRDLLELPRGDIAVVRDIEGPVPLRLYDAREDRLPGPLVLFFHGGGFVLGDLESHDAACAAIARGLDLPVLAVDYRLAPEHPWPAAPDDCEAVARYVADGHCPDVKPTGLVLAGDSAGATLAIVTALALRDRPAALPALALWALYPLADSVTEHPSAAEFAEGYFLTAEGMKWFDRCYRGPAGDWRCSPALADAAGLPPTLVVTAGLDPLRDQGRAWAAQLALAGVPVTFREAVGTIHGFLTLRKAMPSAQGDLAGCLAALKPIITEAEATRVMAEASGALA